MLNVLCYSARPYDEEAFTLALKALPVEQQGLLHWDFTDVHLTPQSAKLAQGHQAVCAFVNDDLGEATLTALKAEGVQAVALRCAGFNNVDAAAAQRLELPVFRVPVYSPHAVAEHALALLLTLNRKTHKAYNRVREGNFLLDGLAGVDLYQKTVGVVGTGHIGAVFCQLMRGLGCTVLAYDVAPNPSLQAQGVTYVPLETLWEQADVISLHCPLLPSTKHLVNAGSLARMKQGVMLINTSRGALVDTPAVIEALKQRKLGALGLDVYEEEASLFFEDLSLKGFDDDQFARLLSFPNVLITAHQAFLTQEALASIAGTTLANLLAWHQHQPLQNTV
jgi:D-lactate dehydrogenase